MNKHDLSVITIDGHPPIGVYQAGSTTVLFNLPNLASIHGLGTGNLFPKDARGVSAAIAESIQSQVELKLGRPLAKRELVAVHFSQDATGLVKIADQNVWDFDPTFSSERLDSPIMAVEDLMTKLMLRNSRVDRSATPHLPDQRVGDFGSIVGMRGESDYVGLLRIGRTSFPIPTADDLRMLANTDVYEVLGPDAYELHVGSCRISLTASEVKDLTSAASDAVSDLLRQADAANPFQSRDGAHRLMTDLERFTLAAMQVHLARQAGVVAPSAGLPDADVSRGALEDLSHLMTLTEVGKFIFTEPSLAAAVFSCSALAVSTYEVFKARDKSRGNAP